MFENAAIGMSVLQVSATDADAGLNGRVRYSIVAGDRNHDFVISEDTGVIRVAKNLNYERRNHYLLTVQAEDSAPVDARYDSATVTISITDINDNAPVFLNSPYVVYVMENLPDLPSTIATVTAFDADNSPYNRVTYLLKEGDKNLFAVNSTTGAIILKEALDREERDNFTLAVAAMDTGTPRLTGTGTISILVQDENDHPPQFPRYEYKASVSEAVMPDSVVMAVTATDLDDGPNAHIRYSILEGAQGVFSVDGETGTIRTVSEIDREITSKYSLLVEAKDSSLTDPRSTTTQVRIDVTDENDNAPTFQNSLFIVYVKDPSKYGEFIFGGAAVDPDEGDNGRVRYYVSGKDADKFSMDQKTGVIKASTTLTGKKIYELEVRAADFGSPPLSSSARVKIHLRPAEQFPEFQHLDRTFSFSESARGDLVTTLTAMSKKPSPMNNIHFAIAGGNIGEAFVVNEKTGDVRISQHGLDYETSHQYEIWISARDSDNPPLTSVTYLTVNVTDSNDNPPVFAQQVYNASIMEDLEPEQLILTISASDRDSGVNAHFTYHLKEDFGSRHSDSLSPFVLEPDTGRIYTKTKLDREKVEFYSLIVEAVDEGIPAQTGTTMVIVTVLDKNDNPPKFTKLFSANITENAEIGTFVIQVTSSDRDIGENANATYSFSENEEGKFSIDPVTGNVTVAGFIDREIQEEYSLKVIAEDGSWNAQTHLTVTVQDENDNPPEFDQMFYEFNLPERQQSVSSVGQIMAYDRDKQGPNSAITYSLKFPSDFFSIDPGSGKLLSKQSLEYKHTVKGPSPENQYQLIVIATDNGKPPMSSECSVMINVVDSNNNPPHFEKSTLFTPVPLSSIIGQKILRLHASDDLDYGINAEVIYEKVGGNGSEFFVLNSKSGWISVARDLHDREGDSFLLRIRAKDRGVPPLHDDVLVNLVVTGENKHSPEFTVLRYHAKVPENEKLGSSITTVSASDGDEGPNGIVVYSITSGNEDGKFTIDETSGDVNIKQPLNYDSVKEYNLNITAHDLAFKPKYATAMLTVQLSDINNNSPQFNMNKYNAFIYENSPIGTSVFQLTATDKDSAEHAVIYYSVVGGSGWGLFSLDRISGIIISDEVFDYEEKSQYILDVMAMNPDSIHKNSAQVVISVIGRNEYYPKFIQPVFQLTVSESARIGTKVGAIQATDEDEGEDGVVYYLLVGSSNDRGFLVHPNTGELTVARSLDREKQSRVVLTVMAKNSGSIRGNDTDEAQVIINIKDGNDPPVFSQPIYEASISEGELIGSPVITVTAVDYDQSPKNNEFRYSIIGGNIGQVFKVDQQTGIIETTSNLDREKVPLYNLTIGAIDGGSPPGTGTTVVHVVIKDINDNGPEFSTPNIEGYVSENEPAMTSVMTLSAHDRDLPPNSDPFFYHIVGGEHESFFTVDSKTGVIKTTRAIDRETIPELNIRIEVEDSGKPKMKTEYPVKIKVLDKNDSPSTPRTVEVSVFTFHGVFPGGKVADVHPNDADTTGTYSCWILRQDSSIFSIPHDCNLHAVRVSHDGFYNLEVVGNDKIHPNVSIKVSLRFQSFSNRTLENSLTVRLLNVTADKFLHFFYKQFMTSLNPLFSGSKVRLYSIYFEDPHTDLTLSVATSDGGYLPSSEVSRKLKAATRPLNLALQGSDFIVDYNPCHDLPCENEGKCTHGINTYEETEVTDSPSFIFTSPTIKHDVFCKCLEGYTGTRCELQQEPCQSNPCMYGGTCTKKGFQFVCTCPPTREGKRCELERANACDENPCLNGGSCMRSLEGDFYCLCRPRYRGSHCQVVINYCRPNPCHNGGTCASLETGYKCMCHFNFYGKNCEKSTYGFEELSYMTFPSLDSTTNDISIVLSTNKPDGLLVYNYGSQTGGRSDFVAVELRDGRPVFSFGGARTEYKSISVEQNVADGAWYRITATRNERVFSLSIAKCSENGEVCHECHPINSFCYNGDTGPTGTLRFNNEPMYLGGVRTVDPIQERPDQVSSDDFIGCIQTVTINGRPMNLSAPIRNRGVTHRCQRVHDVCRGNPCGQQGTCLDRWSGYICRCSGGYLASDCDAQLRPATFRRDSYVDFVITEKYRRRQLVPHLFLKDTKWKRSAPFGRVARQQLLSPAKKLSFSVRTLVAHGTLLYAATNNEFTLLQVVGGRLQYTSKMGANMPVNITVNPRSISDGEWHNISMIAEREGLDILIDGESMEEKVKVIEVHNFLDAYLTSLTIGTPRRLPKDFPAHREGFEGCISTFIVNDELQPLNSSGSLFEAVAHEVAFVDDCTGSHLGPAAVTDPLSVGITLVIIFFILLLVAILASFVVYRFRRQKRHTAGGHIKQNGSALLANTSSDSGRSPQDSGFAENSEMTEEVLRSHLSQELATRKYKEREHDRPQRPDIIEREVINKSPGVPLRVDEPPLTDRDAIAGLGLIADPEPPEHYDLENASSIAPSDIDIVCHYKGYRDGNIRKYKTNPHVPGYHKHSHRHSPLNFPTTTHRESPRNVIRQSPNPVAPRESPSVLKMQSTPLARLSPSSELSQQTPRILTLQDLSGQPLQTALLATTQGPGVKDVMSTSERSLNSPVSHMSHSSGSMHASSQSTKKKKHDGGCGGVSLGLTAEEIERLNARPRNSSLVSTLDAVSSSSEDTQRKDKLAELLETNTELLEAPDSSTDESGNDSFTCSEFEYENNYEKVTRDFGPGNMIFSKLAEVENENEHDSESTKNYDGFDSFRGSLSTLVASDDDLSNVNSYKPPNSSNLSWDCVLNWNLNFENLVGVFRDIAELPDSTTNGRISARGTPKPSEEYV